MKKNLHRLKVRHETFLAQSTVHIYRFAVLAIKKKEKSRVAENMNGKIFYQSLKIK